MANTAINKKIDDLVALGRQLIAGATELRTGPSAKNRRTARKGLAEDQIEQLKARRYKTAFKSKQS